MKTDVQSGKRMHYSCNNEEYLATKQMVMRLCYGLKLTIPEAEMLVIKTDFNLKPTSPENNAYRCTLGPCAELSE